MLQIFILIPNTIPNLGTYVSWYARARQASVFLPKHTSGAGRVAVEAGATLFIPGELRRLAGLPSSDVHTGIPAISIHLLASLHDLFYTPIVCTLYKRSPLIPVALWSCIEGPSPTAATLLSIIVTLDRTSAAGWLYAEVATEDTVALRGHSLQLPSVRMHLEAARIEDFLELRPSLRFPRFYEVTASIVSALGVCNFSPPPALQKP